MIAVFVDFWTGLITLIRAMLSVIYVTESPTNVTAWKSECAVSSTSSIWSLSLEILGVVDQYLFVGMITTTRAKLFSEALGFPQLFQDILPEG